MKKSLKIILIVVLALLLIGAGVLWYVMARLQSGAVDTVQPPSSQPVITGNQDDELVPIESPGPDDPLLGDGEDDEDVPYEEQPIYQVDPKDPDVVNILLIGTDSRSGNLEATGRSDSMMLVSYNRADQTVKLVSLLRDSWVEYKNR